jgi:Ca-activated chloride channel family protein
VRSVEAVRVGWPSRAPGALLLALLLAVPARLGAEAPGLAGKPLAQALRALQADGLRIIYSDSLVRPEMLVAAEPAGVEPAQRLQALLAPHRLMARAGPLGSWLIVRGRGGRGLEPVAEAGALSPPPVFPAETRMVHISALVSREGRPVPGLTAEDFEVRDNSVPQTVKLVTSESAPNETPVHVVLVVDRSDSVDGESLLELKRAAIAFVGSLRGDDPLTLISFADRIDLWPPAERGRQRVISALETVQGGGTTALRDAVYVAIKMAVSSQGRSLVLILTDGEDVGSWLKPEDVLRVAHEADVMLYAIERRRDDTQSPFLRVLARATGGTVWRLERGSDLTSLLAQAVDEARSSYRLCYEPRGVAPGGTHEIEVHLTRAVGKVRARRAYVAPGLPAASPTAASEAPSAATSADALGAYATEAEPKEGSGEVETPAPEEGAAASPRRTLLCRSARDEPSASASGRVLDLYLAGRVDEATASVTSCVTARLVPAIRSLATARSVPALVALHTDIALRLQAQGRGEDSAEHLALARALVADWLGKLDAGERSARGSFWRSWLLAIGYYYQTYSKPEAALLLFELCQRYFPTDARAWLGAGSVYESTAFPDGFSFVSLRHASGGESRKAEGQYRTALQLDPGLAEAHLRLGRVLARRGQLEEAARELDLVTRGSDDPFLVACAWLFLGEIATERGELMRAASHYRFALEVEPELQVALVALSHTLHREGFQALAAETLQPVLLAQRGRRDNLWLDYHRGLGRKLDDALLGMRAELERARASLRPARGR